MALRSVPAVGYTALSMMTPATQARWRQGIGTAARSARRASKRAASPTRKKPKKSGGKLKFGSPAWQKKYRVGKYAKKRR